MLQLQYRYCGSLADSIAVLATIGSLMTLDGMYANGAMTGAIMSSLDFMFNDVLNFERGGKCGAIHR